jgi:hypothetical protein
MITRIAASKANATPSIANPSVRCAGSKEEMKKLLGCIRREWTGAGPRGGTSMLSDSGSFLVVYAVLILAAIAVVSAAFG